MMPALYFTPSSIGYLTQFILSAAICGYIVRRLLRREDHEAHTALLCGFFACLTLFVGLLFLDVTLLPTPRLYIVYLENTVLGAALAFLLQFAYRFPRLFPRHKWESYLALGLSLAYTGYEAYYAVHRYVLLGQGWVDYRSYWADYALAALFVWLPLALFRQTVVADPRPVHWLRKLWQPHGLEARGVRTMAAIFLLLPALSLVNLLRAFSIVTTTFYNAALSVGILGVMCLFAAAYLNYLPQATSFLVKLSGVALTILLGVLGIIVWVATPAHAAEYQPAILDHQTLHFSPNESGGYDIAPMEFHFESELGERFSLSSRGDNRNQAVAFTFPFYSRTYSEIYVTNSGLLAMGQPLYHPNLQLNYGNFAGIFPLLVDLEPTAVGGIFARAEAERLIVTWDHVPALYQPQAVFTFQAILYRDGSFDITYNGLPEPLLFDPDAMPTANPVMRGVTPGLSQPLEQAADLAQVSQSGMQGVIQDFYTDFRLYLHRFITPLAWLALGSSLFLVSGLPLVLRFVLVRPLDSLLDGVRRVEAGNLDVEMPIWYHDEIGFLTRAFNSMTAQLRTFVGGLEERVAARTSELSAANERLRVEAAERELAQARLVQQQRTLATMEERDRLGRELHDGLGQILGYINVQTQAVATLLADGQPQAAHTNLQHIGQMARSAHTDLRNFILGLRTPAAVSESLFDTLRAYLHWFSESFGIQAVLSCPQEMPLPVFDPAVEEQVLHIVQEALTNVRKHAAAKKAEVLFSFSAEEAQIIISDDGVGFTPQVENGTHFGLNIMRERAELVGGRLEARSAPGHGTKVLAFLPRLLPGSLAPAAVEESVETVRGLRLLLVDDSVLFLDGLRNLLMARGLTVVGLARDGLEAQEKARTLRPDVIIMDIQMPRCNGLEATRAIKAELPEVKIVMLTVAEDDEHLFEAIRSGASGYLLKSLDANGFCRLLAGLTRGEAVLPAALAARLVDEFGRREVAEIEAREVEAQLTPRQWEILKLVAEGKIYKEIAAILKIGEPTVKYHMGEILDRLHLTTRAEAVALLQKRRAR